MWSSSPRWERSRPVSSSLNSVSSLSRPSNTQKPRSLPPSTAQPLVSVSRFPDAATWFLRLGVPNSPSRRATTAPFRHGVSPAVWKNTVKTWSPISACPPRSWRRKRPCAWGSWWISSKTTNFCPSVKSWPNGSPERAISPRHSLRPPWTVRLMKTIRMQSVSCRPFSPRKWWAVHSRHFWRVIPKTSKIEIQPEEELSNERGCHRISRQDAHRNHGRQSCEFPPAGPGIHRHQSGPESRQRQSGPGGGRIFRLLQQCPGRCQYRPCGPAGSRIAWFSARGDHQPCLPVRYGSHCFGG